MAVSSVALRCRRLFFLNDNNAAAGVGLGEDSSSYKLKKKPVSLPLGRRKSQMVLRSSSVSSANTIPTEGTTTTTTTTTTPTKNRVSIYSSSLAAAAAAEPSFHYNKTQLEQASKTIMTMGMKTRKRKEDDDEEEEPVPVPANKLDEWIRDSVTEIVRNVGEAPFLVHIYSSSNDIEIDNEEGSRSSSTSTTSTTSKTRFEREPAVSEDWPRISRRWKENSSCKPDGIILVHQLNASEEEEEEEEDDDGSRGHRYLTEYCSSQKSWGIVVQGRGLDPAACYILKTSRVCSSVGFCTHFCLVKAKCFGDPAELQIRDCWLQRQF